MKPQTLPNSLQNVMCTYSQLQPRVPQFCRKVTVSLVFHLTLSQNKRAAAFDRCRPALRTRIVLIPKTMYDHEIGNVSVTVAGTCRAGPAGRGPLQTRYLGWDC